VVAIYVLNEKRWKRVVAIGESATTPAQQHTSGTRAAVQQLQERIANIRTVSAASMQRNTSQSTAALLVVEPDTDSKFRTSATVAAADAATADNIGTAAGTDTVASTPQAAAAAAAVVSSTAVTEDNNDSAGLSTASGLASWLTARFNGRESAVVPGSIDECESGYNGSFTAATSDTGSGTCINKY
jgi:hypothetical protein